MAASSNPTRESRVLGALLGVHAGDSLGATLEFMAWEVIHEKYPSGLRDIIGGGAFGWPAGHATDDTDLTRAVLLAYHQAEKARRSATSEVPDIVKTSAQYMVDWFDGRWPDRTPGETPVDVGGATATGIRRFKQTADPTKSGAGEGRSGNGSLMRCIPTALFQPDTALLVSESAAISAVTHDDSHCTIACVAYNVIVRALVDGESPERAIQAGKAIVPACISDGQTTNARLALSATRVEAAIEAGTSLVRIQDLAENGPKAAVNGPRALPFKGAGYVLESLTIAVAALVDTRPLEQVLVDVVRIGKDTDTNAAIAGGLLGARDGVDAIPLRWREKLQFGPEFTEIVKYMTTTP